MLDLNPRRAAHVAMAIRRYRIDLMRAQKPEPEGLHEIEQAMTAAARAAKSGQEWPAAATFSASDHSGLSDREYFSTAEVAALTGLSERTVRRRVADGDLRSALVGRLRRIARTDLEEFMHRAEVPG